MKTKFLFFSSLTSIFLLILLKDTLIPVSAFESPSQKAESLKEGKRPYELDWANRIEDEVPPLIDFEDPSTLWEIETHSSTAVFESSKEQKIWGNFTGKLTYRGDEKPTQTPSVTVSPHQPIPLSENPLVPENFNTVSIWVYGNNWSWAPDPTTPQTQLSLLFSTPRKTKPIEIRLRNVNWKEWHLLYVRLNEDQLKDLRTPGACFTGFKISGGRNPENRVLFFDNLAFREDTLEQPLQFSERPCRGIIDPDQNQGLNTGKGVLPFPTREETILPEMLKPFKNRTIQEKTASDSSMAQFIFLCESGEGILEIHYAPSSKDAAPWDSLRVNWKNGGFFQPLLQGGISELALPDGTVVPARHEFIAAEQKNDGTVETRWKLWPQIAENSSEKNNAKISKTQSVLSKDDSQKSLNKLNGETNPGSSPKQKEEFVLAVYSIKMIGRSLLLDTRCQGTESIKAANVRYGSLDLNDVSNAKLISIPYAAYAYSGTNRPQAVSFRDPASQPLFLMGNTDWYRGNGSIIYSYARKEKNRVFFNDGVRYLPKTDGRRNPCRERFFVTISPHFEEVLPTIPNPPSPWIKLSGSKQWHARGASNREEDKKFWFNIWRHGIRELIIVDHEVGWRDGGESFTFRTKTAPGKGGDEGQRAFSEFMNNELGYFYGPYNNFTDFAPVNEFWSPNIPSRSPDAQFQPAWPRCYAPKPVLAVEYCEKLTPINQKKFNFRCGYCDVHTAVSPSDRVDYDARVPGAGTWAGVFYSFGEIMLLQKKGWGGPVFSEGPMHHFYAGLNDGSYAQDRGAKIPFSPWLVDYDLLKIHPLSTNIGMGRIDMFFNSRTILQGKSSEERDALIDRFFAATLAFGHPGYFMFDTGFESGWRGYFGAIALQKRFAQYQPEWIRYADKNGTLHSTSEAITNDTIQRSQVVVKYLDGTVICANGSPNENEMMETSVDGHSITLPPTGYCGWTKDGQVFSFSGLQDGTRCDYSFSPDHIFLDGRGKLRKFPFACGSGSGICRKTDETHWEIITLKNTEIGFRIPDFARLNGTNFSSAEYSQNVKPEAAALNFEGKEIGKTKVFQSRGYFYVEPVKGAFSYVIETTLNSEISQTLDSSQWRVLPGQKVRLNINGIPDQREFRIPENILPSTRFWLETDGQRIDFLVSDFCAVKILSETENSLTLELTRFQIDPMETPSTRSAPKESQPLFVTFNGQKYELDSQQSVSLPLPAQEMNIPFFHEFTVHSNSYSQKFIIQTKLFHESISFPFEMSQYRAQMEYRGKPAQSDFGKSGASVIFSKTNPCGGVSLPGFFTHPPYLAGTGRVFLDYELNLPKDKPAILSAFVGKKDGCDVGDGIWYQIALIENTPLCSNAVKKTPEILKSENKIHSVSSKETILAETSVNTHVWTPISANLKPWQGKKIHLRLISDCGPQNNTQGDWGQWGDIRLISAEKYVRRNSKIVSGQIADMKSTPETRPFPKEKILRAVNGWLCYRGKGLNAHESRPVHAFLNGAALGLMLPAHGNENNGIFSEEIRLPLPFEAIQKLQKNNTLEIKNPLADCFCAKNFRIVLELPNGEIVSSLMNVSPFTHPGWWLHAEGNRIPEKDSVLIPISWP